MDDLAAHRVHQSFPFGIRGPDYAGPFLLRERYGRGKCLSCLFIGLTTKALHLGIVTDLTSQAFIALFKRFIARRGKPEYVYSDNGTAYVGANNELSKIFNLYGHVLSNFFVEERITWHFIPPHSTYFGGLWKAAVKSIKFHLKRARINTILTIEEF